MINNLLNVPEAYNETIVRAARESKSTMAVALLGLTGLPIDLILPIRDKNFAAAQALAVPTATINLLENIRFYNLGLHAEAALEQTIKNPNYIFGLNYSYLHSFGFLIDQYSPNEWEGMLESSIRTNSIDSWKDRRLREVVNPFVEPVFELKRGLSEEALKTISILTIDAFQNAAGNAFERSGAKVKNAKGATHKDLKLLIECAGFAAAEIQGEQINDVLRTNNFLNLFMGPDSSPLRATHLREVNSTLSNLTKRVSFVRSKT